MLYQKNLKKWPGSKKNPKTFKNAFMINLKCEKKHFEFDKILNLAKRRNNFKKIQDLKQQFQYSKEIDDYLLNFVT